VVVDNDVSINAITFDHDISYTVVGLASINLEANTDVQPRLPAISAVQGDHQFVVATNLLDDTSADVASASTLSFNHALNLMGHTLTKTGAGTMAINNDLASGGGTLNCDEGVCGGSGTIGGDLNNSSGTVSPGNSAGMLTVDSNYNQGSGGTLAIEIGGAAAGVEHDVLNVLGDAPLAGTLSVSLIDGFTPSGGNTFKVLTASGELTSAGLTLGGPDAGLFSMNIDTANDWITLITSGGAGLPGDYSGNGTVDAADYTIFRDNLGDNSSVLGGNGSGAATVVQADYDLWKQNFGSSGTGSSAAVPEPYGIFLLVLGLSVLCGSPINPLKRLHCD